MNFLRRAAVVVLAVLAFGAGISPASAAFLHSSTGLTSPTTTITFGELVFPNGTVITNQYASLGVTFSNNPVYETHTDPVSGVPDHQLVVQFEPNPIDLPLYGVSILFASNQTAAAFALDWDAGAVAFAAILDGNLVEEVAIAGPNPSPGDDFYGFTGITFDRILIRVVAPAGRTLPLLDDIQLGESLDPAPVPAPPAAVLFVVGLVGLGCVRGWWRKPPTAAA
jgi:hypothetical protein